MSTYVRNLLVPPPWASKTAEDRYRQRQARRREPVAVPDLGTVAAPENLAAIWDVMRSTAGNGPGPDGVTFDNVGRGEKYALLRDVSRKVLAGTYRPGPAKKVKISKASGEYRTLSVRSLVDRVVARALLEAVSPVLEPVLLAGSHGFRPGRSRFTLLAGLTRVAQEDGHWVIATDDVKTAFDSVPIAAVLDLHRRRGSNNANTEYCRGGPPGRRPRPSRRHRPGLSVLAGGTEPLPASRSRRVCPSPRPGGQSGDTDALIPVRRQPGVPVPGRPRGRRGPPTVRILARECRLSPQGRTRRPGRPPARGSCRAARPDPVPGQEPTPAQARGRRLERTGRGPQSPTWRSRGGSRRTAPPSAGATAPSSGSSTWQPGTAFVSCKLPESTSGSVGRLTSGGPSWSTVGSTLTTLSRQRTTRGGSAGRHPPPGTPPARPRGRAPADPGVAPSRPPGCT